MKKLILISLILFTIITVSANNDKALSPTESTDVSVLIDNEAPIIEIISPKNTIYNNATPLLVNYTIFDHSLYSTWYSLNNQENITISQPFYIALPEGKYNLKIYANGSANRINFSEVNFIINNSVSFCGDAACNIGESCNNCQIDCGVCPSQDRGSSGGSGIESSKIPETEINETQPLGGENISYDGGKKPIPSDKIPKRIRINYQIMLLYLIILILILVIIIFIILYNQKRKKYKNGQRRNRKA